MKSFLTNVSIRARPEHVWEILTNLSRWPQWNTTVSRVTGEAAPGQRVTVSLSGASGRAFPVRVVEFTAPKRMIWSGGMPLGLFKGTRVFDLSAREESFTEFQMSENYTGLLVALIGKSIPDLQPAFDEFAQCLKREAEKH
jgi:hypothetical protein